uniref:WD repeat domain 27 n=1 Tax=Pelusios castaneus TaxID=367368 RepID=A0A8C8SVU9_9SAUR
VWLPQNLLASPGGWDVAMDIVLEKQVFRSKVSESHVQLACSLHYYAFPLNGNELCIWTTGNSPAHHQPLHLVGHHHSITALSFGNKIDPLLLCSASCDYVIVWNLDECTKAVLQGRMPRGVVIGTLLGMVLYVRFSPDDQAVAVCAGNRIYVLNNEAILAELEGHLAPVTAAEFCTWEKNILVSVSEDRSFKVWDYCTGLLIYQSAVLTAFPLLSLFIDEENKQLITGCADGQVRVKQMLKILILVTIPGRIRKLHSLYQIQKFSKLYSTNDMRPEETVETTLPVLRIEHCDESINLGKEENLCLWIGSSTGIFIINLANFELEAVLHYKGMTIKYLIAVYDFKRSTQNSDCFHAGIKGTMKGQSLVFHSKIKSSGYTTAPQDVFFTTYKPIRTLFTGDGELLACGLADKSLLIFNSNLRGTPAVFSGHNGAINSVGWSHDKKWLVSASEDRTLRIWSIRNTEPALFLGKEMFHKSIRFAQFYYIDTFILLCCGPEFHLLSYYLDTSKDDLKRYKQKSICKLVQKFPMASTVEITSLSAINDFYSYIILAAGSNRALEVFDLNAGCSAAMIPDAHSRSVHQICQNKGSAFSTQPLEAYNLFMTTALGDGIKLWDLRTLRCERRFEGHINRCHPCGIAVTPCGQFIACGSEDKSAYVYEMRSSTFSHKLAGHTESVINVAFSPSSPQVCYFPSCSSCNLNVEELFGKYP